jgi:hypothetical protein
MDPNQQNNPSGVPTDVPVPTPEVTPTPDVEPTIEPTEPQLAPSAIVEPESALPPEPVATEESPADPFTPTVASGPVANAATPATTISGQSIGTASTPPQKKPKKGLIISIIIGALGLVAIGATVLVLFIFDGKKELEGTTNNQTTANNGLAVSSSESSGEIKTVKELREAIQNQKAINCNLTMTSGGATFNNVTIQTNDGWSKIHLSTPSFLESEQWIIKDGDEYVAYLAMAGKNSKVTGAMAATYPESTARSTNDSDIENLVCKPNNQADFTVPDRDWEDYDESFHQINL